jgi:Flp pilus assembly pilin Flp
LIVALVSATAIGAYGTLGNALESMYGVVESAVLSVVPP